MASTKKLADQEADLYLEAGKIASRIRSEFSREVREGRRLLDLAEDLESEIIAQGARPAFPCNVGVNEIGAHYTPLPSDTSEFSASDLVKVDFGLHLDGYIVDTAFTVALSSMDQKIVEGVNECLRTIVQNLRVEDKIQRVGALANSVSEKYGFKVIENLQGHEIRRYVLHAGVSVPNVPNSDGRRFHDGMVVAMEPFFTYSFGAGRVMESDLTTIFKSPEGEKNNKLHALQGFHGLPICERWAAKLDSHMTRQNLEVLQKYPMLVEERGAPIAQAETTLLFRSDQVIDLVS